MFSATLLAEEVESWRLEIWGLLVQEDSNVDLVAFASSMGIEDGYHLVTIKKEPPPQLSTGEHWTETGYLNFGKAEVGAHESGVHTLYLSVFCFSIPFEQSSLYIYISIYIYISHTAHPGKLVSLPGCAGIPIIFSFLTFLFLYFDIYI